MTIEVFFFGDRNISEEIPIKEIRWHNKGLTFKRHGNATNYFEEKLFSQFPTGTTRKEVEPIIKRLSRSLP